MHAFFSDNVAGMCPELLAAIAAVNEGYAPSYADDALTTELDTVISSVFETPVAVFLTSTGTAANALSIAGLCPPWKRTLCHRRSHVMESEAGAPEAYSGGGKLSAPRNGPFDKLSVSDIETALRALKPGDPHSPYYGLVSISQVTESGSIYSIDELRKISAIVKRYGAHLHMDGARFANALAATGASPADMTTRIGVNALSLGIAKNGGALCELIVLFDRDKAAEFRFRQMRGGQLLSKHRFWAAQALAYFRNGLWLRLAEHANRQAKALAIGLQAKNIEMALGVEANLLFPLIEESYARRLIADGHVIKTYDPAVFGRPHAAGWRVLRLVTSWKTTEDDVQRCIAGF
ncbi:threonine aldolase family protein [Leptospira interrogans]